MNLCTNCKFVSQASGNTIAQPYLCTEPTVTTVNPVNGITQYPQCSALRSANGKCGPDGTKFVLSTNTP